MSDGVALLAAIRANPADLAARLAYADWLQERGQEARAELVRVGVELSRPAPERPATMAVDLLSSAEHVARVEAWRAYSARREQLDRRERGLLDAAQVPAPAGWRVVVGLGLGAVGRRELLLRRGLVERAACPAAAWVADGDAILAEHPVRSVRLAPRPDAAEGAARAGLSGDPAGRTFGAAFDAARRPGDSLALSVLRCRWPGIDFELPGG
jgi:uncharacterized protein (TIGR02996 family)